MAAAAAPAPKDDPFIQEVNAQIKKSIEDNVWYNKNFFHYFFGNHPKSMKSYVEEGFPYFKEIFDIYKTEQHYEDKDPYYVSFDYVQKEAAKRVQDEIPVRKIGFYPFRDYYFQAKAFFGINPNLGILGVILEKAEIAAEDTPTNEEIKKKIKDAQSLFLAVLHGTELRNLHDHIKFFLYVYLIDVIMKLYNGKKDPFLGKGFIQDNYYQNIWMDFYTMPFLPLQRLALSKAIEGVYDEKIAIESLDSLPSQLRSVVISATNEPVWTGRHTQSGKKIYQ